MVVGLPVLNRRVIRSVMNLLRQVAEYSEDNLMKMEALTKIFAPTLIRGPTQEDKIKEAMEELMINPTVVGVVQILFQDFDAIFTEEEEQQQQQQ